MEFHFSDVIKDTAVFITNITIFKNWEGQVSRSTLGCNPSFYVDSSLAIGNRSTSLWHVMMGKKRGLLQFCNFEDVIYPDQDA